MTIDSVLSKHGLTFEELKPEERSTLLSMLDAAENNTLSVEKIKIYIYQLKESVEHELSEVKDVPNNWVSVLVMLIPLVGVIRKWYQDQRTVYLQARLRNLVLLSNILSRPDQARKDLEASLEGLATRIQQEREAGAGSYSSRNTVDFH